MHKAIRITVFSMLAVLITACPSEEERACARMKKNPPKPFMKEIEVTPGETKTIPVAELFTGLDQSCILKATKEGPENGEISAEIQGKALKVTALPNGQNCIDREQGPSPRTGGTVNVTVQTKCKTTLNASVKVAAKAPQRLCENNEGGGHGGGREPASTGGGRGMTAHFPSEGPVIFDEPQAHSF